MNGLSILFLLLIFLLGGLFILGLIILVIGLLKKNKRNTTTKAGIIILGIPLFIFLIAFIYDFAHENFTKKPDKKDLVGVYFISETSGLIPKSSYKSYRLEFKNDGTFYLTSTPHINICENGKYGIAWQDEMNELSIQCEKGFTTAHIDRSFSGFRIEFIIGDPDSGQSIYFTKEN